MCSGACNFMRLSWPHSSILLLLRPCMRFVFAPSSMTSWGIGLHDTAHLVDELVN